MNNTFKHTLLQKKLCDCLYHFLYSSLEETHLRHFINLKKIGSDSLSQWYEMFLRCYPENIDKVQTFPPQLSVKDYASHLAEIYRIWAEVIPQVDEPSIPLPDGQPYDDWLNKGGDNKKYWPVQHLKERLDAVGNTFFLRAIAHGSIGTLDDTEGFSDMDLAFIVRHDVLCNTESLLKLRRLAAEILSITYCFDPFMHHGPYYLSEIDLHFYPQSLLPSILFEYGLTVFTGKKPIYLRPHVADYFTDSLLDAYLNNFIKWSKDQPCIKNSWDIEVILGTPMLLPALYLQRTTGEFNYKRDTFEPGRKDFTAKEWEPIQIATEIRNSLSEKYRPSQKMLNLATKMQWPGLIQRLALNKPKEKERIHFVRERIGINYTEKVISLIKDIQNKIAHEESESKPITKKNVYTDIFNNIITGPYTDEPFEATSEDYEKAKAYLVEYWVSLHEKPITIYQLGSVGAPGHSDLDFIVIWPDQTPIPYSRFKQENFPEWLHPYLIHPPYFCTPSLWSELHAWYPAFDLNHLWGKIFKEPETNESHRPGFALALLVEIFLTKMPEDLFFYALQTPVRLRVVINTLHSLKYTVRLAELAGINISPEIKKVVSEIDNLRKTWNSGGNSRYSRLKSLCISACSVLQLILDDCIKLCSEIYLPQKPDRAVLAENGMSSKNVIYKFSESTFRKYIESGKVPRLSHPALLSLLSFYKEIEPKLGPTLHQFVALPEIKINNKSCFLEGIKKHVVEMVRYADVMIPMGIPATKYYALGYSPERRDINPKIYISPVRKTKRIFGRILSFSLYLDIVDSLLKTIAFPLLTFINRLIFLANRFVKFVKSNRKVFHRYFAYFWFIKHYTVLMGLKIKLRYKSPKRRLLAISLVEHIGDIVACEPVSRYVRQKYPEAYIIWCVRGPYRELIDSNPNIDKTLVVNCLTEWIYLAKSQLFNKTVDLHIKERICPICRVPLQKPQIKTDITLENYFLFGNLLSVFSKSAGLPVIEEYPRVYIPKSIAKKMETCDLPNSFIAINCLSNEAEKDWVKSKWRELVLQLINEYKFNVVEVGLSPVITNSLMSGYKDLCGKPSILESAEVIRRSKFFIGVDSGPAQLANAVGTYGIILIGHYRIFKRYMPYSGKYENKKNGELVYEDGPVANISVDRVLQAVEKYLEGTMRKLKTTDLVSSH
jgi:ADP-heptose:LPS heptosyltransferase